MGKKRSGTKRFFEYYHQLYGDRWLPLLTSLKEEPHYMEFSENLLKPYFLDQASYIAAASLPIQKGDSILDLCAAPGGKTLVLASRMTQDNLLTANDRSQNRTRRLKKVLREHLPDAVFNSVRITNYDAARWCLYESDAYDKILLDVPCSSERHIINSEKHLEIWSPARTKSLSIQAYAILSSAFALLKPGGVLVYSTCALSPFENDGVINKLLKRKDSEVCIYPIREETGESTAYGWQILPDTCCGMGPIYFSKIGKYL